MGMESGAVASLQQRKYMDWAILDQIWLVHINSTETYLSFFINHNIVRVSITYPEDKCCDTVTSTRLGEGIYSLEISAIK